MGETILATLTWPFQVINQIRLGETDARVGTPVQIPEVPAGVRLASEGTFFAQTTHEDWSYVLEERRQVQLGGARDTTVLALEPVRVHETLALESEVPSER